jgi:hypothetical protein
LLAAAGTAPDAAYPSDGEDLGPIVTGRAALHQRKLFWRYKAGSQRAMRDGNWKYLRIAGNEFLFDLVQDPRERANLKDREKDVFDRLKRDWEAWNGTMLEERSRPATYFHAGNVMADHYGVVNPAAPGTAKRSPQELTFCLNAWHAAVVRRVDRTLVGLGLEKRSPFGGIRYRSDPAASPAMSAVTPKAEVNSERRRLRCRAVVGRICIIHSTERSVRQCDGRRGGDAGKVRG